ncbi:MAG TPA: zinc-dependent metalloprotease [Gemmatimonadales bacterium]|jgi:hypothetical protein
MQRSFVTFALLLAVVGPAAAQEPPQGAGDRGPFKPFADVVKDATEMNGFFDLYRTADKLYLAVPADRLEQDFLLTFEIARGIGSSGLFGGTMLDIFEGKVVAFERHGNTLYLVQKPHRFPADPATPVGKAVDLTFGSSVLETAKIESVREDSALVIDIQSWIISDMSDVSSRVRGAVGAPGRPGRANLDKGRSYIESVKAFPENLSLRAKLTFTPGEPANFNAVPDSRYIPVSIHTTMAALPEQPMTPRVADDRMGYFLTVHKDFTQDETTFFARYVNKWRLECETPAGDGLCTPREPITYYIDRTVPVEYRQAMIDGVQAWNTAFEAAGFNNGIRALMLPDDADAEDIRYATLRWNVSDQPGYGAIGPSVVDPRTGEVLDADILFEQNMILGWKSFWRTNVDPVAAFEEMFAASDEELNALAQGGEMASMADEISAQGSFLRAALVARGAIAAGDPVPDEYIHEAMLRVTMHEVGHTLGLRHNFKSSFDTPFEQLHDRTFTKENGLASSVMEYPGINVAPKGQAQGYFYSPGVGSSDKWVIAYGYTPDAARAREVARQGAMEGHAYGPDEDARGSGALDPSVSVYDLSDDPMGWGKERADMIRGIWQELPQAVLTDNARYADVTAAYSTLLSQYARATGTGIKYIGGQYLHRDHVGDPNRRDPFVSVPKAQQQEALAFLTEYGLSESAFRLPPEVFRFFGADRWSHWGNTMTVNGRIDYPIHEQIASLQASLVNQITNPFLLARIRDAEVKFGASNVLTIPELMNGISNAVWSEVWNAPGRNVPSMRRDLQRAHLDRMIAFVTDPPDRTPADARSVARAELEDLHQRLTRRLTPPFSFDAYTTAHLNEAKIRIERALEAGMDMK